MSQAEFLAWAEFYRNFPFDDKHRYHRPAALVATSMGGGDVQANLDWLQPPPDDGRSQSDRDLYKAVGISY